MTLEKKLPGQWTDLMNTSMTIALTIFAKQLMMALIILLPAYIQMQGLALKPHLTKSLKMLKA